MGSEGYIWGREFSSTQPLDPRELEIKKHWYRILLWGRVGYDPDLPQSRIEKIVGGKLSQASGAELAALWATASKIIPTTTREHYHSWDFQWSVEYCSSHDKGFHFIDETSKEYVKIMFGKKSPNVRILDNRE